MIIKQFRPEIIPRANAIGNKLESFQALQA